MALGNIPMISNGAGRFSQLVFTFPDKRAITVSDNPSEPSIEIHFDKTSVDELSSINFYDEVLVHRAFITDLGPSGSKLKLVLKNTRTKANVATFMEPFRVAIDLFEDTFTLERDPRTSLPVATGSEAEQVGSSGSGSLTSQLESSVSSPMASSPNMNPTPSMNSKDSGRSMKLLDPLKREASSAAIDLDRVQDGRGPEWAKFPIYIYPIQSALYHARSGSQGKKEMSSGESLAEYGLKLYNFGHELKALEAYKSVMRKEPQVFDTDPLHLWAVAEIYLGKGELSLARSYQQALREKHPDSPLATLSLIRDLDMEALKLSTSLKTAELPGLVKKLSEINDRGNNEVKGQIAIRKLFWGQKKNSVSRIEDIPVIDKTLQAELASWWPTMENPKTAYIAASIIVNQIRLSEWDKNNSEFLGAYLEKYKDSPGANWVSDFKKSFETKLADYLQKTMMNGDYIKLIESFEAMPKSLAVITDAPATAWAVAEAYRNLGKPKEALTFYAKAAKATPPLSQFKAIFWTAILQAELNTDPAGNQSSREKIERSAQEADSKLFDVWKRLRDDEKSQIAVAYKTQIDSAVSRKLKTPSLAKISLELWTKALSTKADLSSAPEEWTKTWRPTASTVVFLKQLADDFEFLGLPAQKQATSELITRLKPDLLGDDPNAKNIWLNQLIDLAEEHRKANRYLDAGRLFADAARNSDQWDRKAEALYKGGLLLYRAGQKEEAVKALTQAAEDTNNFFYANLAKERLNQLEK
jgi:tetratricopeptide (TPR) repeat protein